MRRLLPAPGFYSNCPGQFDARIAAATRYEVRPRHDPNFLSRTALQQEDRSMWVFGSVPAVPRGRRTPLTFLGKDTPHFGSNKDATVAEETGEPTEGEKAEGHKGSRKLFPFSQTAMLPRSRFGLVTQASRPSDGAAAAAFSICPFTRSSAFCKTRSTKGAFLSFSPLTGSFFSSFFPSRTMSRSLR